MRKTSIDYLLEFVLRIGSVEGAAERAHLDVSTLRRKLAGVSPISPELLLRLEAAAGVYSFSMEMTRDFLRSLRDVAPSQYAPLEAAAAALAQIRRDMAAGVFDPDHVSDDEGALTHG